MHSIAKAGIERPELRGYVLAYPTRQVTLPPARTTKFSRLTHSPIPEHHWEYILFSESSPNRLYTGCTTDLKTRVQTHNAGDVNHAAKSRP